MVAGDGGDAAAPVRPHEAEVQPLEDVSLFQSWRYGGPPGRYRETTLRGPAADFPCTVT
jgi:hypothetical protein